LASLAVALTLGAVQVAFAQDVMGNRQAASVAPETGINRATKSDRASVPASPGQTETIALRPDGLTDTSVLVRVPVAKARNETRNVSPPSATRPADQKIAVACEPPVSVLTEVAKLLQPGRCVT